MAWSHSTQKIESEGKTAKRPRVWWGLGAGLIVAVAAVAGVVSFIAGTSATPEKTAPDEEAVEAMPKPKPSRTIPAVTPAAAPRYNVVAEKLLGCKFLVNGQVKKQAKVYLCLFSASWCGLSHEVVHRRETSHLEAVDGLPQMKRVRTCEPRG